MKAKLKTIDVLKSEGFKPGYSYWYIGDKRYPDAKFRSALVDSALGQTVTIVKVRSFEDAGSVNIEYNGVHFNEVPLYLFDQSVDITKLPRPIAKQFNWASEGELAKYYQNEKLFSFSCDFKKLKSSEAKQLAKWILQVAK